MVNPLALLFLLAMCFVILRCSRQNAVGALLVTAAIIPLGQEIYLFGLHLYFLRILILAGLCRLLMRQEAVGFSLTGLDKLFIAWVLVGFVCGLLRGPSPETFGVVYDSMGVYFLIRILIRNTEDFLVCIRVLAFVGIIIGACMAWEAIKHRNPFYVFGGVPEVPIQRGDRFRAQGPFLQPILAGTFGATLFPLLFCLWRKGGRGRWLMFIGMIGSIVTTIASASSGPLLTFIAAVIGFCLWPMRERMYLFRWGIVSVFIGFALVMKAPVWYLLAKVSDLVGGGGWHRSYVIDTAVKHFSQWWLIGTSSTANWSYAGLVLGGADSANMDITNHYIIQGINGGVLMLVLFLAIITGCFKIIGQFVRGAAEPPVDRKLLWALGVCLASHCMAFISVSYFDQIQVFWFWLLAMIATVPMWATKKSVENLMPQAVEDVNGVPAVSVVVLEDRQPERITFT